MKRNVLYFSQSRYSLWTPRVTGGRVGGRSGGLLGLRAFDFWLLIEGLGRQQRIHQVLRACPGRCMAPLRGLEDDQDTGLEWRSEDC